MTLSIKNDASHPGGGYALLEGCDATDITGITIENCFSSQFLGEDGRWGKTAFAFPVEVTSFGALSLGPHIVDRVPSELQVALRSQNGTDLGKVFWADIMPSRNPGSRITAQVLEERARLDATNNHQGAAEAAAYQAELDAATAAGVAAEQSARRIAVEEAQASEQPPVAAPVLLPAETMPALPPRRRFAGIAVGLLLLVVAGACGYAAFRPTVLASLKEKIFSSSIPAPFPGPTPWPAPHADPNPRPRAAVDCGRTYGNDLSRLSDPEKVKLGENALHDSCGAAAFRAFDSVDWQANEAAAWNVARFYDPNETDPVYRQIATVHPDYAAAYYKFWRDRSPRQASALAKICNARNGTGGSASLQQSCAR